MCVVLFVFTSRILISGYFLFPLFVFVYSLLSLPVFVSISYFIFLLIFCVALFVTNLILSRRWGSLSFPPVSRAVFYRLEVRVLVSIVMFSHHSDHICNMFRILSAISIFVISGIVMSFPRL